MLTGACWRWVYRRQTGQWRCFPPLWTCRTSSTLLLWVRLGSVCRSVYQSPAIHIDICLCDIVGWGPVRRFLLRIVPTWSVSVSRPLRHVYHNCPFAMAICIMNAKVSGLMVGLNVWGMDSPAFSIFAASWSRRAAPRALCLSSKPLMSICQYLGIALLSSGVYARRLSIRSVISLRIASLNCSASGALSASRVDMFSSTALGIVRNSGSCIGTVKRFGPRCRCRRSPCGRWVAPTKNWVFGIHCLVE